jgi:hypothetical protein
MNSSTLITTTANHGNRKNIYGLEAADRCGEKPATPMSKYLIAHFL